MSTLLAEDLARTTFGFFRQAAPIVRACRAARAGQRVLLLEHAHAIQALWQYCRAEVDPTCGTGLECGELYDSLRLLAAESDELDVKALLELTPAFLAFLTAYGRLEVQLTAVGAIACKVKVSDSQRLLDYAQERGVNAIDLADLVLKALVTENENPPPAAYGLRFLQTSAAAESSRSIRLEVSVQVSDPAALLEFATVRYQQMWFEPWEPASLEEALWEALIASNLNPSPDLCGLELGGWEKA
jgi:hypothetical protein